MCEKNHTGWALASPQAFKEDCMSALPNCLIVPLGQLQDSTIPFRMQWMLLSALPQMICHLERLLVVATLKHLLTKGTR